MYASLFKLPQKIKYEKGVYSLDTIKVATKILRQTYSPNLIGDISYNDKLINFRNLLLKDVSKEYGFDNKVVFNFDKRIKDNIYLCHFFTGGGWKIVDAKYCNSNEVTFYYLPKKDFVCLHALINDDL